MHRSIARLVLLLAIAAVSCGFFVVAHASCWPHERDALLAFKQGINDTNDVLASWQKRHHDCCQRWTGVTCSNETGHVTELDLGETGLVGQISPSLLSLQHLEYLDLSLTYLHGPSGHVFPEFLCSLHNLRHLDLSYTSFSGRVPPQLGNLSKLEYLDLAWTSLHGLNGRVFPEFLCSLHNLRHLDLSNTLFSGRVPPQLPNLSKLDYLDLSGVLLSGILPPQLANLSKLDYLDLSGTLLSGILPPQLGNLSNLRHLGLSFMENIHTADISWLTHLHILEYVDLSDINLSAVDVFLVANTIPTLKALILANCSLPNANQTLTHLNLTKLENLDLSRNNLGHPIETCWFWNLKCIKDLALVSTYLYGPFPDALGGMTTLQSLEFTNNGNSATMTVDLKNLCDLESLWLDGGLALGNITEFVRKLPQCSSSKLFFLSSSDNNMTGTLPDMVGHLTSLKYLLLSNNSITGAIPSGLRKLTSLDTLNLNLNQLTGQIPMLPRSLTELAISMNSLSGPLPLDFGGPNLIQLSLSSNYLTGHVPKAICESKHMAILDLSNNLFEGEFPRCSAMSIAFLLLSNNNFSGNFPSWLKASYFLIFLDLGVNKFYGMLPAWIGQLVNLRFLQLNHNMFYGDIPVNITNLKLLQYFSLASNNISGSIPLSLSKLTAMTLDHPPRVGSNWLEEETSKGILSVVMKQQELKYGTSALNEMVSIDLSLNRLTSEIPNEIGSLNGLLNLNLSRNLLSGKISMKIGSMKSLESLDLSRNNLSGETPSSLSDLTFLSSLDLSYNSLAGRIPTGGQLDTLYNENPFMYSGNSGLCGPPLEKSCPGNDAPEHGNQHQGSENGYDPVLFFYFGLTAGFLAGLWIVFCALLFKRSWRNAYFRLFDKLYDNVYVFSVVTWGRIGSKATAS
ncbi:uncharacterized protein [Lolium perenne]|uniref:uncharacterized protein n=1 Tax=Lolium perenne TaxID=4522 RepID=UPI0021EA7EB5|nr:probable leucine-rich repeat receptor-like protein kinase At1g35710 [Lolium perenne]